MPVVSCNDITDVLWKKASADAFVLSSCIHVWRVCISAHLDSIPHFRYLLSDEEQVRALKYHYEKDRQRFIISRGILRIVLGQYINQPPELIGIVIGENKKPFVAYPGAIDVHYNLSHSGDRIVIAVSNESVGIDVEQIAEDFSFMDILADSFSQAEINFIKGKEQQRPVFYRCWTCKEALAKATGKGIDSDMIYLPCLDGDHIVAEALIGSRHNWAIRSFEVDEQYIGSVAYGNGVKKIMFWDHAPD